MILKLLLFFTFITSSTSVKAKEDIKTIKFHPPETEAERALDRMLKIRKGKNLKYENIFYENIFTKKFIADYKKQEKFYLNSENCKKYNEKHCCFLCYIDKIVNKGNKNIYYHVFSKHSKNLLLHWTNCKKGKNKCIIGAEAVEYYMKKENGKWKIDGFNTGEYDGDMIINIDFNDKDYYKN